jgi:hypothetical protein
MSFLATLPPVNQAFFKFPYSMSGICLYYRCTGVNHNAKEACKIRIAPTKELENAVIYRIRQLGQNSSKLRRAIEIANKELVGKSTSLLIVLRLSFLLLEV